MFPAVSPNRPLLVIASHNQGKLAEIKSLLAPCRIEAQSALALGFDREIAETGTTFMENALLKAQTLAAALQLPALADDSGLEVDALAGAPGVHSARFAAAVRNDRNNNAKLLAALRTTPMAERAARFRCVMAIVAPDGAEYLVEGVTEGLIGLEPRGTGGFGYDPLFCLAEAGLTMAELTPSEKNKYSHRGKALRQALRVIQTIRSVSPPRENASEAEG
ncbi:MAG: XTP/dITP diphosphatase [Gracilibacteraceae bacterium]|jgi:XTP/dITP diphosphohydrolase|nr:XTP/dITP diphosphatase [Gracilibacteraceae bacterium]